MSREVDKCWHFELGKGHCNKGLRSIEPAKMVWQDDAGNPLTEPMNAQMATCEDGHKVVLPVDVTAVVKQTEPHNVFEDHKEMDDDPHRSILP